jgi:hypothetical protein
MFGRVKVRYWRAPAKLQKSKVLVIGAPLVLKTWSRYPLSGIGLALSHACAVEDLLHILAL